MAVKAKDKVQQKVIDEAWLHLPDWYDEDSAFNPLLNFPESSKENPHIFIIWLMSNPEYFAFFCKYVLNFELLPMQLVILQEMWYRKFPMLIGSRGLGKCVKNGRILTDSKVCKIEDIVPEDYPELQRYYPEKDILVFGENGFNKVEYAWKNPKEKTVKIKTDYRYKLEGTQHHPIRVVRDGEIVWKEMSELKLGDIVPIDRTPSWITKPNNITPDVAYWMGALVGDGGYTSRKAISFTNQDKEVVDLINKTFIKLYGKGLTPRGSKGFEYQICAVNIWDDLFSKYGFGSPICEEKDVPSTILASSKECVAMFLRGLMDTDGYVEKNGASLQLSAKSPYIIYNVQFLLTRFGIISKVRKSWNKKYQRYYYKLDISGDNIDIYIKEIGFTIDYKKDRLALTSKTRNTNKDVIPHALVLKDLLSLRDKYAKIRKPTPRGNNYERKLITPSRLKKYEISYLTLSKILEITKDCSHEKEWIRLKDIFDKHYFYDEIVEIKSGFSETYDVHIPNDHSFISNGFISHNTSLMAIYTILRLLFLPKRKVVVAGASFRQSKLVFEYMETIWNNSPVLRDLCGPNQGPSKDVDMYKFRILDSVAYFLPIGDGCLSSNTLITYDDKVGYINDGALNLINKRNKKIYGNFQFNETDELYHNGVKPTKVVTSKRGYTYEGTLNHKMKVMTHDGIVWKRTDQIKVGDYILIDRSNRWHSGTTDIRNDEAYACGLMTGDGCWTNTYRLGFAGPDEELIPFLNRGLGCEFVQAKNDKIHFICNSKENRTKFLTRFSLPKLYSYEKYIPEIIMSSSKNVMTSFLRGLFDSDGHVTYTENGKKGNSVSVGYTTTSKRLAYELQYILLHYGIICSLSYRDRKRKGVASRRSYEILITGQNVNLFRDNIGFNLIRKHTLLEKGLSSRLKNLELENIVPYIKPKLYKIISNNPTIKNKYIYKLKSLKNCTFKFIKNILESYKSVDEYKELMELANEDIFYDKVINIDDSTCDTYDLHVPEIHEYCAGGFFSHNSKIRGLRANDILIDEFASHQKEIFETVISGFGAVSSAPLDNVRLAAAKRKAEELGVWEEDEHEAKLQIIPNQIILSGTAYYDFNHFADYWKSWHKIIESRGDKNKLIQALGGPDKYNDSLSHTHFSIMRIPFEMIPEGFMDAAQVARSRATFDSGTYTMEFGAVFSKDSNGFFKRSLIESCSVNPQTNFNSMPEGVELFEVTLHGRSDKKYVYGIDPASEVDRFAIVIIEIHNNHRRIVYCWTTNKKEFQARVRSGVTKENEYYSYCARKIRELMKRFPTDHIAIDSQGGGYAVLETLHDKDKVKSDEGELPMWEWIDPTKAKESDGEAGLHNIYMVNFSSADYTRDANHGLKADFENKVLLFPFFDAISLAEASLIDASTTDGITYDSLDDCIMDIEELKDELSSIVMTQTPSGREHWDTPEIKLSGSKKGRLRKDRYSALLMANMLARNIRPRNEMSCTEGGGFATYITKKEMPNGPAFVGPAWFVERMKDIY